MGKMIVSLTGEQPIPNLLPLRYQPPDEALLVHTDRTEGVAQRLRRLLEPEVKVHLLCTDPYDVHQIRGDLQGFLAREMKEGMELEFNLTGGTKTMVLAAYELAREHNAPFFYLQSEGRRSVLYRYRFEAGKPQYERKETLPCVITIDDYLKAHVGDYNVTRPRHNFEEEIGKALAGVVDEVMVGATLAGALEVDLVVRKENQVGVIQAKTGSRARSKVGLDQLNAACEQRYLGTYTHKILAINQHWDESLTNLRELANAWRITVVELPSFTEDHPFLSPEDKERLRSEVIKVLAG